jgi:hypothetical protein
MSIVRPGFIGAAYEEPFPAWTDAEGTVMGVSLMIGLGMI